MDKDDQLDAIVRRLEFLELANQAQLCVMSAMASLVPVAQRQAMQKLLDLYSLQLRVTESAGAGKCLDRVAEKVTSIWGHDHSAKTAQAAHNLALHVAQASSVPPHLQRAHKTFSSFATFDDLAQDATEHLQQLTRQSAAAPAPPSRGASTPPPAPSTAPKRPKTKRPNSD